MARNRRGLPLVRLVESAAIATVPGIRPAMAEAFYIASIVFSAPLRADDMSRPSAAIRVRSVTNAFTMPVISTAKAVLSGLMQPYGHTGRP